jgi:hypothetical protein
VDQLLGIDVLAANAWATLNMKDQPAARANHQVIADMQADTAVLGAKRAVLLRQVSQLEDARDEMAVHLNAATKALSPTQPSRWNSFFESIFTGVVGNLIELDPRREAGHLISGRVYASMGQFDRAISEFESAAAMRPGQLPIASLGATYAPFVAPHSCRSTIAGSTAVAFLAGIAIAIATAHARPSPAATNATGSTILTGNTWASNRSDSTVIPVANSAPKTNPTTTGHAFGATIARYTSARRAPSASRIPISFIRRRAASATTPYTPTMARTAVMAAISPTTSPIL